jgi:hypothetical protein
MSNEAPKKRLEFVISPKGEIRGIYSPESDQILRSIAEQNSGEIVTRRASHVEPTEELRDEALQWLHARADSKLIGDILVVKGTMPPRYSTFDAAAFRADCNKAFPGRWWADLTPVNGPVLGPYATGDRDKALADEIEWLKANGIPVCDPCMQSPYPGVAYLTDGQVQWGFSTPGWYFWCEDEASCMGPWASAAEANTKAAEYAKWLDERPKPRAPERPGTLDYAALERRLLESGNVGEVIVVDSATGIDAADPRACYGELFPRISRLPQGTLPQLLRFAQPPQQNISPLPPEKQKLRKAFLTGTPPDPPKRRGR